MEWIVPLVLAVLGAIAAVAAYAWWSNRKGVTEPPPRAWKGDTVTPMILGPRNRAPERVARSFVATQGALLAVHMAKADGDVSHAEREAIRTFILDNVTGSDEALAERALSEAEAGAADPARVDSAVEGLRAVGSSEQRQVLVDLLVHVAHVDGVVRPAEIAFMQRVGDELGLTEADVKARIALS